MRSDGTRRLSSVPFLDSFCEVERWSSDLNTSEMRVVALPISLGCLSRLVFRVELWSFDARILTKGLAALAVSLSGTRLDSLEVLSCGRSTFEPGVSRLSRVPDPAG